MKNRISILAAAFAMTLFCLGSSIQGLRASAAETVFVPQFITESEDHTESYDIADPIAQYDANVEYAIVPVFAGGYCLDRSPARNELQLYKTHRDGNQRWKLQKAGEYYRIVNPASGLALTVLNGRGANGVQIVTSALNTSNAAQLWKLDPAGDGSYYIRAYASNFTMDAWGNKTENNIRMKTANFHGERNQRFFFEPLTTVCPMEEWGATRQDCYGSDWDYWDGSSDNSWYYADKNARTYYIHNASELAGAAQLVRNNVTDFSGRNLVLTRDLNLCGIEWSSIGTDGRPFRGSFIGGNHAIIGLIISSMNSEHGLFGCVRGSVVRDFAVKGTVVGDWNTGGVCGKLDNGILYNVYSEVTVSKGTDDNLGGIVGRVGAGGCVEHCTQNARVNSGDQDPDRGGIVGYCDGGVVRYCVNKASVECNWDYVGGIAGRCVNSGMIEYCANYGQVSGGSDTERAGGIAGAVTGNGLVFGCYNEGYVYSSGDDYIGGIVGYGSSSRVYCSINNADVRGRTNVGGIMGDDKCLYCLNLGTVLGSKNYGSITGETGGKLIACRALHWTWKCLNGKGGENGAQWVTGEEVISGKACFDLNGGNGGIKGLNNYWDGGASLGTVFYQNIGGDLLPTFTGSKVILKNGKYVNEEYNVRVSYPSDYGTVEGAGTYQSGAVKLTASPALGCLFDHYEITKPGVSYRTTFGGSKSHSYPTETVTISKDPELTLTENIDSSYTVKAVFTVYDDVPEELRQNVKIELKSEDECSGWNSETIAVYLVDSAGEQHLWEVNRSSLDDPGDTATKTFDLGAACPVALYAYPDFGGWVSFHDQQLSVRMWLNNAGTAIESSKITIRSYPFISSVWGGDYLHFAFDDLGNSTVGLRRQDGTLEVKGTYTKPTEAWAAAQALGENAVLRLDSAWIANRMFETEKQFTLDLNGFPIVRNIKKAVANGGLIRVKKDVTLNIIDSSPKRSSCSAFRGGSIQGGRSTNSGGLIQVDSGGTLYMTGGTLYNGGSMDTGGGGLRNAGGNVTLEGVTIASCWANVHDGGGVYTNGGTFTARNCTLKTCKAGAYGGGIMAMTRPASVENTCFSACSASKGGAVYVRGGELNMHGGTIRSCSADSGGAICNAGSDQSKIYCDSVLFERNHAGSNGGAVLTNSDEDSSRQNYCWLLGCAFRSNSAGGKGGAVCVDSFDATWLWETDRANSLFMQGCTVTNNASSGSGGGIFAYDNTRVEFCGQTVIQDNEGAGSRDNLVLSDRAYLYDSGLESGSMICLSREESSSGPVTKDNYLVSSEHMKYLKSDRGTLEMTNQEEVSTVLHASVFTKGHLTLIFGTFMILMSIIVGVMYGIRKRKGDQHED